MPRTTSRRWSIITDEHRIDKCVACECEPVRDPVFVSNDGLQRWCRTCFVDAITLYKQHRKTLREEAARATEDAVNAEMRLAF